jgi:cell division protease FtsH
MVCEWGMSEAVGPLTFGRKEGQEIFLGRDIAQQKDYSEDTAIRIDQEIKRIVTDNYDRARSVLTEKKSELLRIAEELLTREVLSGDQVKRIVSGQSLEAPATSNPVASVSDQPTSPEETERPPVVSPLGKPLPQQ